MNGWCALQVRGYFGVSSGARPDAAARPVARRPPAAAPRRRSPHVRSFNTDPAAFTLLPTSNNINKPKIQLTFKSSTRKEQNSTPIFKNTTFEVRKRILQLLIIRLHLTPTHACCVIKETHRRLMIWKVHIVKGVSNAHNRILTIALMSGQCIVRLLCVDKREES